MNVLSRKKIQGPADLAINGAPPAFDKPLHVGRPNIADPAAFQRLSAGIIERGWLTNDGPVVRELETRIAAHLGVRHCVATCNGTLALEIAIRALGLRGEVIVPSYTFIATAHALHWHGIKPVFADIDPATHNIDPRSVEALLTPSTSGIIGVHLWGRPAPVAALQQIADRRGLPLLYDAAHAFGCSTNGRSIGQFGTAEILSFHATKFFNSFEGGGIVTNDDALAEKARLMRNFGFAGYDNVIHPGTNAKMPEICAAMGIANFDGLDRIVDHNRRNYRSYLDGLADIPSLSLLRYDDGERNNYQYIVAEVRPVSPIGRDAIVAALHAENVLARRYFWPGCHRMEPYRTLDPDSAARLPQTQAVAERVIVLPTGLTVSDADISTICAILRSLLTTAR